MPPKNNIVFFLGAGFSKGFCRTIPITEQILGAVFKELANRKAFRPTVRGAVKAAVRRIFPHLSRPQNANLEFLLGVLESVRRDSVDTKAILGNGVDAGLIWHALISAIGRAVHYSASYPTYFETEPMKSLIKIMKRCKENSTSMTIITTNYDLIADKAAFWVNDRILGQTDVSTHAKLLKRWTYGIPIRGVWTDARSPKFVPGYESWARFDEGISVYKLHGSVNWAYCERCGELDLSHEKEDFESVYSGNRVRCAAGCGGKYAWFLLPPMHAKEYGHFFFRKIWRLAEDALAEANRVVFIGYALPQADPTVTSLILRAMARSSHGTGTRWKYWVFIPRKTVQKRYKTLLGPPDRVVGRFSPRTFERKWLDVLQA